MRITCTRCQSTYQLAEGALGATGRKVRCTRCGTVWHAMPGAEAFEDAPPSLAMAAAEARFPVPSEDEWKAALADPGDEEPLPEPSTAADPSLADVAEEASSNVVPFKPREASDLAEGNPAEEEPPAEAPTIEAPAPGFEKKRARAPKPKPGAKARRAPLLLPPAFVVGASAAFVGLVGFGAVFAREGVVRLFPDFAGLYALAGLDVNLRGLDFEGVRTYREVDGATPVLVVEGAIENTGDMARPIPTLRFALKSASGREVYAWTMTLPNPSLDGRASARFKSRLPAPPDAATELEVRFTDGKGP